MEIIPPYFNTNATSDNVIKPQNWHANGSIVHTTWLVTKSLVLVLQFGNSSSNFQKYLSRNTAHNVKWCLPVKVIKNSGYLWKLLTIFMKFWKYKKKHAEMHPPTPPQKQNFVQVTCWQFTYKLTSKHILLCIVEVHKLDTNIHSTVKQLASAVKRV